LLSLILFLASFISPSFFYRARVVLDLGEELREVWRERGHRGKRGREGETAEFVLFLFLSFFLRASETKKSALMSLRHLHFSFDQTFLFSVF